VATLAAVEEVTFPPGAVQLDRLEGRVAESVNAIMARMARFNEALVRCGTVGEEGKIHNRCHGRCGRRLAERVERSTPAR